MKNFEADYFSNTKVLPNGELELDLKDKIVFPKNCRLNYGSYSNGEFKYTKNHQNKQ